MKRINLRSEDDSSLLIIWPVQVYGAARGATLWSCEKACDVRPVETIICWFVRGCSDGMWSVVMVTWWCGAWAYLVCDHATGRPSAVPPREPCVEKDEPGCWELGNITFIFPRIYIRHTFLVRTKLQFFPAEQWCHKNLRPNVHRNDLRFGYL